MKKLFYFFVVINLHGQSLEQLQQQAEFFKEHQEPEKALSCYEKIVTLRPKDITTLFQLGCVAINLGQVDKAITAFSTILQLCPDNCHVLYNIAYCQKIAGRMEQAIQTYKQVLSLYPTYHNALFGLGMTYLQQGDFTQGWLCHEFELKKEGKNSELFRKFLKTNTLKGKKILLRPEGGLGDSIMFIRYAHILKELGATTIAVVQKELAPLLSLCPALDKLYTLPLSSMPACDEAVTLMSLPALFNAQENTMSLHIPYLQADPERVQFWHGRLHHEPNFKIGICWQANVHNDSSRTKVARRGIPLELFKRLALIPGVSLYSLQQYDGTDEIAEFIKDWPLTVFDTSFDKSHGSFMDTAAVMFELDLIISVDSAVAHLAGALNRPIWLLLPFASDWRWISGRTDSPWYPSMTIFKQKTPFDWEYVMQEVENNIRHSIHEK